MARAAFVALFMLAACGSPVFAADYLVTKTTDSSDGTCDADCSLREAIIAANASPGADRIILGPALTYTLSVGPADAPGLQAPASGDLDILDALTIDGNGSTVDAVGIDRVFDVRGNGAVTINNLTIANGIATGWLSLGGGIYIGAGSAVVLNGSTVTGNSTAAEGGARDSGGGIAAVGSFNAGTGVTTFASLTLIDTTVSGNTGLNGGGIVCVLCTLAISNGTITGNIAEGSDGGGIDMVGDSSTLSIVGSSVSGNTAAVRGGGVSVPFGASSSSLSRDRIVSNTGGIGAAIFTSVGAINATNNWWGCSFGPGAGGAGCAAASNGTAGAVTASPYLVLRVSANPSGIVSGASSTTTADLTFNSSTADTSSGGTVPDGITAAFAGTLGSFATPSSTTSGGRATDLFTAAAAGTASLSTTVDSQTAATSILIGYGTATALQGSPISPVFVPDAVLLTATVTSVLPAGGIPTGTVTFKDGAATLSGCGGVSLNAGGVATCSIPGSTLPAGIKSFTAEFAGGVSHLPSTSPALGYTYVACTANPVVANSNDSGAGSLRQAIADACPGSTITFNMGTVVSPIGLTSGTLTLGRNVTITGPGANVLTVQRSGGTFGVVTIQPGLTVGLSGITIAGGTATASPNRGGGVYNNGSTLALSAVALTNNTAGFGGGLYNNAEVAGASVTIVNSTLSGNSASVGGAINNQSVVANAHLTIRNTTISGNVALGNGGAIFNGGPTSPITITNGTIVNNRNDSVGTGGGMYLEPGSGPVVLENTIVARNRIGVSPAITDDDVSGALDGSSTHSLVGTSAGMTGITNGVGGNLVGTPASPIDPRLSALLGYGGPTFTHALLAGSPALDAGDNALAAAAGLTTDQRGVARTSDGPDPDTIATVDIGAFEAGASLAALPDRTITEDGVATVTFELSDPSLVTAVTASSANTVLVPNNPSNISVTGSGATRTLTITPVANAFGTADITVTVTTGTDTMSDTLLLTVGPVADTPSVTNASTSEDTVTASGLVLTRNPVDGAEVTHFRITGISGGTLLLADAVTPVANGSFVTAAQGIAGFRFLPAPDSFATSHFTAQASIAGSDAGLGGSPVTASISVTPVADTPSITGAVTSVNTQTSSGLVVTRNASDGPEVTHFKVTGINRGTLFQHDGTTPIALGAFITVAEGNAGLRFTPETGSMLPGLVTVRASLSASDAGLGGAAATANIIVSSRILTTGGEGPGAPMVRRFVGVPGRPISGPTAEFLAFAAGFTGGVRVADADITGDGVADVIAGTGPGVEPRILVFDGATGAVVRDLLPGFGGSAGVYVGAGDVDGDGWPDIIAGDGGGSALVRVVSGASGAPLWSMPIADPAFSGGVRVAAGDVDGDGYADLIVGSGPGGGSSVRIFSGATHAELRALAPFAGFVGGVFVAAGDVNGDGYDDIIAGADAGGGSHVRVFDGATGVERFGFFATDAPFTGGVRVAAGDVTGDGNADVIIALGPGGNLVDAFDGVTGRPVGPRLPVFPPPPPPPGDGLFISTAAPANRMVIDAPSSGASLPPDFRLSGWAFEEDAPGIGVAAIHVWAYPVGGGAPAFLGVATLGDPRPDVGATFGGSYAASGYHLDVTGLAGGTYDIVAFANSSASGQFNMRRVVRVRIVSPGAEVQLQVDAPAAGPVRPAFRVAGWAFDVGGVGGSSGIEAVHVWAFPAAGGSPMFVGAATLGDARPDVAALFGPRAANAGYHLDVSGLAGGDYVLRAYAKALALPAFTVVQAVSITVTPWAPAIQMSVDVPAAGTLSSGTFMVAGWALALDAPSAPGIAAVHVWAYPVGGGAPSFLGAAALGGARPDVAAFYGPGYQTSGFGLPVIGLPSGTWDLAVFPLAAGAPAFDTARVIRVTVP